MSEYVPTTDDFRLAWEVPGQRMRELDEKYVTAIERHHEAQRGIAALKAEALQEAQQCIAGDLPVDEARVRGADLVSASGLIHDLDEMIASLIEDAAS